MITRFLTIVNMLVSLERRLSTEELVDKVFRTLQKTWNVKLTAIRKFKNLTIITLYELVGNLKTYEMNMEGFKKEKEG